MNRKLPSDSFERYVALGSARSYSALAESLGVSKRSVSRLATREDWTGRLKRIEIQARQNTDRKIGETLEQMRERHLATLRAMHARALSALAQYPLTTAMEAVRTLDTAIKLERLVTGEATERTAIDVEEVIKREYDRWMVRDNALAEVAKNGNADE